MELLRISDQLRRCAHGPAWHGPSLEEVLEGVSRTEAVRRFDAIPHSIAEFVLHIRAWADVAGKAISGAAIPEDLPNDWTIIRSLSESAWAETERECLQTLDRLAGQVKSLGAQRLTDTVPGRDYDYYLLLHGVVEHTIYHAGQIALLKRLANGSK